MNLKSFETWLEDMYANAQRETQESPCHSMEFQKAMYEERMLRKVINKWKECTRAK